MYVCGCMSKFIRSEAVFALFLQCCTYDIIPNEIIKIAHINNIKVNKTHIVVESINNPSLCSTQ